MSYISENQKAVLCLLFSKNYWFMSFFTKPFIPIHHLICLKSENHYKKTKMILKYYVFLTIAYK